MELQQLRYFMETAKQEHITKAAEILNIAQPALSQSIKRLEEELNVPLFARESRGVVLNENGKQLKQELGPILESLDNLKDRLKETNDIKQHTIHLNILAASVLITNCIISYRKLHPNVKFKISQDDNVTNYDLCISSMLPNAESEKQEKIFEETFFLAVPKGSKYDSYKNIKLSDTAEEGYICLTSSKSIRSICDHFCMISGFIPNIIFESDNPESVRNIIRAGLGIGFWPEYSWGKIVTSDVILLPIQYPICKRDIVISRSENFGQNNIVKDFHQYLLNCKAKPIIC